MIPKQPIVSIIIPTFNRSSYIYKSMENCLNQTYRNIELIIVDDGSTDDTFKIINSFHDDRLRLVRFEKNQGHIPALNKGFSVATGDFLTWTSDDNSYFPDAIEQMALELIRHREIDFVYAKNQVIDQNDNILRELRFEDPDYLDTDNCIGLCFLYRRKVYVTIGDFNQEAFLAEDYEYWLRVREKFRMKKINTILYSYRIHEKSLTGIYGEDKVQEMVERVRERFIKPWRKHYFHARKCYENQNRLEARREVFLSLKYNVFYLPTWRLLALTSLTDPVIYLIRRIKRLFWT
ncbi:MAG: glycosyltransferase [Candidatus Omnitrophica bacterium]|nr:glycosyltransferase [Candidatus Omnitrophota bacterium]